MVTEVSQGAEISYGRQGDDLVAIIHPMGTEPPHSDISPLWFYGHSYFRRNSLEQVADSIEDIVNGKVSYIKLGEVLYSRGDYPGHIVYLFKDRVDFPFSLLRDVLALKQN